MTQKRLGSVTIFETVDDFMKRTYWNCVKKKVLIFIDSKMSDKGEVWPMQKAQDYLNYLKQNENAG